MEYWFLKTLLFQLAPAQRIDFSVWAAHVASTCCPDSTGLGRPVSWQKQVRTSISPARCHIQRWQRCPRCCPPALQPLVSAAGHSAEKVYFNSARKKRKRSLPHTKTWQMVSKPVRVSLVLKLKKSLSSETFQILITAQTNGPWAGVKLPQPSCCCCCHQPCPAAPTEH